MKKARFAVKTVSTKGEMTGIELDVSGDVESLSLLFLASMMQDTKQDIAAVMVRAILEYLDKQGIQLIEFLRKFVAAEQVKNLVDLSDGQDIFRAMQVNYHAGLFIGCDAPSSVVTHSGGLGSCVKGDVVMGGCTNCMANVIAGEMSRTENFKEIILDAVELYNTGDLDTEDL